MSTPPAVAGPDTVTAIELVLAVLDGRPFLPLFAAVADDHRINVVGGLIHLATVLGDQITGENPAAFRAALAELQAYQRLADLFTPEET